MDLPVNDGKIPWEECEKYKWANDDFQFVLNNALDDPLEVIGINKNYKFIGKHKKHNKLYCETWWKIEGIREGYEGKDYKPLTPVQRKINYIYKKQRERGINV